MVAAALYAVQVAVPEGTHCPEEHVNPAVHPMGPHGVKQTRSY